MLRWLTGSADGWASLRQRVSKEFVPLGVTDSPPVESHAGTRAKEQSKMIDSLSRYATETQEASKARTSVAAESISSLSTTLLTLVSISPQSSNSPDEIIACFVIEILRRDTCRYFFHHIKTRHQRRILPLFRYTRRLANRDHTEETSMERPTTLGTDGTSRCPHRSITTTSWTDRDYRIRT